MLIFQLTLTEKNAVELRLWFVPSTTAEVTGQLVSREFSCALGTSIKSEAVPLVIGPNRLTVRIDAEDQLYSHWITIIVKRCQKFNVKLLLISPSQTEK